MTKYNYDFSIEANNEQDADLKIKSLAVIGKKLTVEEVEKFAHMLLNDPVKTRIAKSYL